MTLPLLHMSSFILSYFGVLGATIIIYKSAEISIIALKKIND